MLAGFLALLQFAMPFLHAHSGPDFSPDGFHMHGLQLVRSYDQPPDIQSLVSKIVLDGLIVSVGSAVKCDKRSDSSNDLQYINGPIQPFVLAETHKPVNFSPHEVTGDLRFVYNLSAPRAPPV